MPAPTGPTAGAPSRPPGRPRASCPGRGVGNFPAVMEVLGFHVRAELAQSPSRAPLRDAPERLQHDAAAHLGGTVLSFYERDRYLDNLQTRPGHPDGQVDLEAVARPFDLVQAGR